MFLKHKTFLRVFLTGIFSGCFVSSNPDVLHVALESEPAHLHPLLDPIDGVSRKITSLIYDSLLVPSADGSMLRGRLASSWTLEAGGARAVFYLKKNAYWHDGMPITAHDVEHTVRAVLDPKHPTKDVRAYLDALEGCYARDALRVECVFKKPYTWALEAVGMLPVLPAHIPFSDMSLKRTPSVGSGPFKFVEWKEGVSLLLAKNHRYHGEPAHVQSLQWHCVPQSLMRVQLFKKKSLDIVEKTSLQHVNGMPFLAHLPSAVQVVGWNHRSVFFKDVRVRKAMTHMLNRAWMIQTYRNNADILAAGWFYPGVVYFNPEIQPLSYNPSLANSLLEQAGWVDQNGDGLREQHGKPFRFTFVYPSGYVFYEQLASWMVSVMKTHGVEVVPVKGEWSVVSKRMHAGDFDACGLLWQMLPTSDPSQIWHSKSLGAGNILGVQNTTLDALLDQANGVLDTAQRTILYRSFAAALHDAHPYTPLFYRNHISLVSNRLKHVVSTPYGVFDYTQIAVR